MRNLILPALLLLPACHTPPVRMIAPPADRLVETPRPVVPDVMTDESTAKLIVDYDAALGACNADKHFLDVWLREADAR